jgi:hypothetical protein
MDGLKVIYFFSVADFEDIDNKLCIVNGVNNSVITLPDSVKWSA